MPGKLKALVGSSATYNVEEGADRGSFRRPQAQERTAATPTPTTPTSARAALDRQAAPAGRLAADRPRRPARDRNRHQSPIAVQTAKAIRRAQDDRFLQGFYGNAYTGEEGATRRLQGRQHHGRQPGRSGAGGHHAQQADRHAGADAASGSSTKRRRRSASTPPKQLEGSARSRRSRAATTTRRRCRRCRTAR
jgi:hypothetical protein